MLGCGKKNLYYEDLGIRSTSGDYSSIIRIGEGTGNLINVNSIWYKLFGF